MSRSGSAELGLLALVALAGCGDPLADGLYPGDPLYQIEGVIYTDADVSPPTVGVRVTVLWGPNGEDQSWEQSIGMSTTFPARFTMRMYGPAPGTPDPQGAGEGIVVGAPVLYADNDLDEVYDYEVDDLTGGTEDMLLFYTGEDGGVPRDPSWTVLEEPGYHAMRLVNSPCLDDGVQIQEVDPREVALYLSNDSVAPMISCEEGTGPPPR